MEEDSTVNTIAREETVDGVTDDKLPPVSCNEKPEDSNSGMMTLIEESLKIYSSKNLTKTSDEIDRSVPLKDNDVAKSGKTCIITSPKNESPTESSKIDECSSSSNKSSHTKSDKAESPTSYHRQMKVDERKLLNTIHKKEHVPNVDEYDATKRKKVHSPRNSNDKKGHILLNEKIKSAPKLDHKDTSPKFKPSHPKEQNENINSKDNNNQRRHDNTECRKLAEIKHNKQIHSKDEHITVNTKSKQLSIITRADPLIWHYYNSKSEEYASQSTETKEDIILNNNGPKVDKHDSKNKTESPNDFKKVYSQERCDYVIPKKSQNKKSVLSSKHSLKQVQNVTTKCKIEKHSPAGEQSSKNEKQCKQSEKNRKEAIHVKLTPINETLRLLDMVKLLNTNRKCKKYSLPHYNKSVETDSNLYKKYHRRKNHEPAKKEHAKTCQPRVPILNKNIKQNNHSRADKGTKRVHFKCDARSDDEIKKSKTDEITQFRSNKQIEFNSCDTVPTHHTKIGECPEAIPFTQVTGEELMIAQLMNECDQHLTNSKGVELTEEISDRKKETAIQSSSVHTDKIALSKNKSHKILLVKVPTKNNNTSQDQKGSEQNQNEWMIPPKDFDVLHNMHIFPHTEGKSHPKTSSSQTDSEETLSNVESTPNSPAQTNLSEKNMRKVHKDTAHNSPYRDLSGKNADAFHENVQNNCTDGRSTTSKVAWNNSSSSIANIANCKKLVETDPTRESTEDCTVSDKINLTAPVKSNVHTSTVERPWLRHYERPRAENALETNDLDDVKKNEKHLASSKGEGGGTTVVKNVSTFKIGKQNRKNIKTTGYSLRSRSPKSSKPVDHVPKKRGRPRKKPEQPITPKAEDTKDPLLLISKTKPPSISGNVDQIEKAFVKTLTDNGHAFNTNELKRLYLKYMQDKHFRANSELPPFIPNKRDPDEPTPPNNHLQLRLECYDNNDQHHHPMLVEKFEKDNLSQFMNQGTIDTGVSGLPPVNHNIMTQVEARNVSTATIPTHQDGMTMNVNAKKTFPTELVDLTTGGNDASPVNITTVVPQCTNNDRNIANLNVSGRHEINSRSFNAAYPDSMSLTNGQHANGTGSSYNQNSYQMNRNHGESGKTPYYSAPIDPNVSMNCANNNMEHTNLTSNTNWNAFRTGANSMNRNNHSSNSTLSYESNSMNSMNGINVPYNSQNSIINSSNEWSGANSSMTNPSFNSVNADINPLHHPNSDVNISSPQMNDGNPAFSNNMNMNNPLMNRANNFMNSGFPVMAPWNNGQLMFGPYMNGTHPYVNNMFNPYNHYMGFESPLAVINNRNYMGNNIGPWMQNMLPYVNNGNPVLRSSTLSGTNSEPAGSDSFSSQGNVTNLPLPSVSTILNRTNVFNVPNFNNHNVGMSTSNAPSRAIHFQHNSGINNNYIHPSTYPNNNEQTYATYSSQYRNEMQNTDFPGTVDPNTDGNYSNNCWTPQHNSPENYNYPGQNTEGSENVRNFRPTYERTRSPDCEIIAEVASNRESDIITLQQKLRGFVRDHSNENPMQTCNTKEQSAGDDLLSYIIQQSVPEQEKN